MEHFYDKTEGENWFDYPTFYAWVVKNAPNDAHFVEVGVWKGRSACYLAVEIANSKKNIKFDCVDTWTAETDPVIFNKYKGQNDIYDIFLKNIEPVKDIISPVRLLSLEAAKNYADESLDFVFIDASHDYENVKKDVEAWLPKIKKGGILGGHDYFNERDAVKQVVDEKFGKLTKFMDSCWYIRKA